MQRIFQIVIFAAGLTATASAQDWQLGPFTRPLDVPVISPNKASIFLDPISQKPIHWEALHTFNPAATIAPDGSVAVVYRAEDDSGVMGIGGHTSRLGLATSSDGLHFKMRPAPVLYMDNDAEKSHEFPGGVEDPRIVQAPDGSYVVTYTQWARDRGTYTIGIATSKDLVHWTKHGPAFDAADGGHYKALMYKSAGILTELRGDRLIAAKLHGKFWMYWGEIQIRLATSDDLINWTPVVDPATHEPHVLLAARSGHFDSGFPETGPPPVLTSQGIVMLYNAKNSNPEDTIHSLQGDPAIAAGAYSVGEALFSADDPTKLLARTDQPVFKPERPYERTGQYAAGTTFAEGLVPLHGKWFLYYGTADSFVGVATAPMKK
ncbi:glycoside hydrolase family 130 protein [Granulicella paludicola]|uniref:glycoside hydrolase family 130 protein n=1 Tax=Granulicella paludicola TaxID=474951 RepID=UPI0021DFD6A8|nr:glycoside hydrolase family 130 protein [Granulicella paludicola]